MEYKIFTAPYLNTVVAGGDFPTLNFNGRSRMSKLAFKVWSGALVSLVLPTDLQLKPAGVLLVKYSVQINVG